MKILEDHNNRLTTALTYQQAYDCVIRLPPTLSCIKRSERVILVERIEKIQHWRNRIMQRGRRKPGTDFLSNGLCAVVGVDSAIMPEKFDHRQIRRCPAI